MATKGKEAWNKYYFGKLPLTTRFHHKRATTLYDLEGKNRISQKPIIDSLVTVLPQIYPDNNRILISFQDGTTKKNARIHIDDLVKPKVANRTISNKFLTPDNLNLSGIKIFKNNYIKQITHTIDDMPEDRIQQYIKLFLIEFLEKSEKTVSSLDYGKDLLSGDIATIAKDFGEITGPWWFMNNHNTYDYVQFPTDQRNPLFDYYVGSSLTNVKLKISAKAKSGAAPGLISVWNEIQTSRPDNIQELEVWNFIRLAADKTISGIDSLVECAKYYESKGYLAIKNSIFDGYDFTANDVQKWIQKYSDADALQQYLHNVFYSKLPIYRGVDTTTIRSILGGPPNSIKSGIILSPMSYSLIDEVNKNINFTNYLNKICQSMQIQQLKVFLTKTNFRYSLHEFTNSKFQFDYHSNSKAPAQNKFGYKMI